MFSFFTTNEYNSSESLDIIENIVYDYLKTLGFKKHGRTLHRFVDGDISQVINFQNGCPEKGIYDILWVNLGIRIPECVERKFITEQPLKKYYHKYECNIRTHLGGLTDNEDTFYSLKKNPAKTGVDIVDRIKKYVIPVFDVLNNRDSIIKHRTEYSRFDLFNNHLVLLEEAMIYGRNGDLNKATQLFNKYYNNALEKYNYDFKFGIKTFIGKGKSITYRSTKTQNTETLTATDDGYVIMYNANESHLTYLEKLANELGIKLVSQFSEINL